MIAAAAGVIGLVEPLDTLSEQFPDGDADLQARIVELQGEFGGWRRGEVDGNCFYRAFGFAHVESVLRKKPKNLRRFLEAVQRSAAQEAEGLLELGQSLLQLEPAAALERWHRAMLSDPEIDRQLVRAMRLISADFLVANQDTDFDGMPLKVFVESSHGMDVDTFRIQEILVDGREAEALALMLGPMALEVKLEIVILDGSGAQMQRYCVPDVEGVRPTAALLSRPGRYDVLYGRKVASELYQLQERLDPAVERARPDAESAQPQSYAGRGSRQASPGEPRGVSRAAPGESRGADSLDEALTHFRQQLREHVQSADRAIELERLRMVDKRQQQERTRRDLWRLREENDRLRLRLEEKRLAMHQNSKEVSELRELGQTGGFWALCYVPMADTTHEVNRLEEGS